jgi:hypothetical protein
VGGTSALRASIGLAVVAAGVVLLGAFWISRHEQAEPGDPGDVVRVGVVQGQSVPGYLKSSRTDLDALTDPSAPAAGETWALVSLDDYVPAGLLPGLFEGAAVAQVYTRVPLPGAHTQVVRIPVYRVPEDVRAGMLGAAVQRDQERAEYLHLADQLPGDDPHQERARRAYESSARTAGAEADAYRSECSCVFAAVVRAAPAALRGVADRPGVRAVDPAPEVRELDRTEFRPPLPEQRGTVPADPGTSSIPIPVPKGSSAIATRTPAPILSSTGHPVTSASSPMSDPWSGSSAAAPEERAAVPSAMDASPAQSMTS